MIQEYEPQFCLTLDSNEFVIKMSLTLTFITNDKVDYNNSFHLRRLVQYVRGQCQTQWRLVHVADGHDVCLLDMCSLTYV